MLVFAVAGLLSCQRATTDKVTADQAHFTLEGDKQPPLKETDRWTSPNVYFHATLHNVPTDASLTLDCEWTAPDGQIAHRNHYDTRTITHDNWDTHCRNRFNPSSPPGTWTVAMSLEGRQLAKSSFELRAGAVK